VQKAVTVTPHSIWASGQRCF